MKKNKRKKRSVTLIEIMIVILLIGLIGGALAFNMRGSMDKGKVFKSQQNSERVYNILMMAHATGDFNLSDIGNKKLIKKILNQSPLVKDGESLLKDAWGEDLTITLKDNGADIDVFSARAVKWENEHKVQ